MAGELSLKKESGKRAPGWRSISLSLSLRLVKLEEFLLAVVALHEVALAVLRPRMGMGQNTTTRNRTAAFSLWFPLPGFHFGYAFLTHSQISPWARQTENRRAQDTFGAVKMGDQHGLVSFWFRNGTLTKTHAHLMPLWFSSTLFLWGGG